MLLDVAAPWFVGLIWRAGQQPDLVLANSAHTANRIQAAWGRDAAVVYPPVRTHFFTPGASPRDDFLLWVGAIEPAKRLDRVIDLAKRQGRRLVVVGEGSQSARMRKWRGAHNLPWSSSTSGFVSFTEQLPHSYNCTKKTLGSRFELLACGCPVMVHCTGGHSEIVTDGVGVQVDAENEDAIDDGSSGF